MFGYITLKHQWQDKMNLEEDKSRSDGARGRLYRNLWYPAHFPLGLSPSVHIFV
jgi:hypothetical protein